MSHKAHKGKRSKFSPHIRHYWYLLDSAAWRSLSPTARCLEMELKRLFNGTNNGDLFLSVREAARRLGVAPNTAAKAFRELEDRGFIKPRQKGSFAWKKRHATTWILTEEVFNNELPTKEFMRWKPLLEPHEQFKGRTQILVASVSRFAHEKENQTFFDHYGGNI